VDCLAAGQVGVMEDASWRALMRWLRAEKPGRVLLVMENVEAVLGTIVKGQASGVNSEVGAGCPAGGEGGAL
jgi:hypothetical protein